MERGSRTDEIFITLGETGRPSITLPSTSAELQAVLSLRTDFGRDLGNFWSHYPWKGPLGKHFRHNLARNVGQAEVSPLKLEGQLGMIHT